jgi:hypothetical protein
MAKKIIDTLDELHVNGELSRLVSTGFVSGSLLIWRNAYHSYVAEFEKCRSKMQAMQNVADEYSLSVRTVQYIRDRMEQF